MRFSSNTPDPQTKQGRSVRSGNIAEKLRFALLSVLLAGIALSTQSCTVSQKLADRATGFYRRGSCVSVDIPPITLTPARTAAERQLIGKEALLEEDGWIVASAKNAPGPGKQGESDELEEVRRLYRERSVLEFYEEKIKELRLAGILGESFDGTLKPVPERLSPRTGKYRYPFETQNAIRIAQEVNRSRKWIYEYQLKIEKKKATSDPDSIRENFLSIYRKSARPGEWVFTADQKWEKLR